MSACMYPWPGVGWQAERPWLHSLVPRHHARCLSPRPRPSVSASAVPVGSSCSRSYTCIGTLCKQPGASLSPQKGQISCHCGMCSPARSLSPAVLLAPDSQDLHVHTCSTFPDGLLVENCLHGANTKSWQVARSELVVWLLLPREYEYEWCTLEMPIYHIKMLTGNKLTNALIYLIFHYEPNTHNTILLLTS